MLKRRDVLQLAGGAAASLLSSEARPQTASASANSPFSGGSVIDAARALATKPFKAPNTDLPGPLSNLSYEAYAAIQAKSSSLIWSQDNVGFVLEPLHRGYIFTAPVQINLVDGGQATKVAYDAGNFIFGGVNMSAPPANLDFSGFRVLYRGDDGSLSELAIFQGGTFFRSKAPGQNYGVMARALAVRPGDPREEIPNFRAIWIEKPSRAANVLVIHALVDSESLTGAFRFTLHPGDAVIIDTECTLFPRTDIDVLGLGAMGASTLFSALDRRDADDVRNAVAEISGLQILTGGGEWLWRPATNRANLQISEFVDHNPRGFGFLQRGRTFEQFHDDIQHWELRPSLWIEPIGDWGAGSVELLEIPSDTENAQNMIAFWRTKAGLTKGQSAEFAYRQFWCWSPPSSPPLAVTVGSRGGRGSGAKQRRFLVDFQGEALADPAKLADVKPNLSAGPGRIAAYRLFPAPEQKRLRVQFDLDTAGETACELRLVLESQGAPVSETWLYRWTS